MQEYTKILNVQLGEFLFSHIVQNRANIAGLSKVGPCLASRILNFRKVYVVSLMRMVHCVCI